MGPLGSCNWLQVKHNTPCQGTGCFGLGEGLQGHSNDCSIMPTRRLCKRWYVFFCLRDEWLQCHSNDSSFGLRLRMAHCYQEANTYTWLHLPFGMFAPESPRRRILYRHPALKCATVHNLQIKRELHIGNINRGLGSAPCAGIASLCKVM